MIEMQIIDAYRPSLPRKPGRRLFSRSLPVTVRQGSLLHHPQAYWICTKLQIKNL